MLKINPVIIDYGVGNIFSLSKAIEYCGYKAILTDNLELIDKASHLFLPGVGSFERAVLELKKRSLFNYLKKNKEKKIMGICLGMQLLFEKSFEMGEHAGLGIFKGVIQKINFKKKIYYSESKIPNIGWHRIKVNKNYLKDPIFFNISDLNYYFLHSYYAKISNVKNQVAFIDLNDCKIPAIIKEKNIYGCQFHPEKSRNQGLNILKNFLEKI